MLERTSPPLTTASRVYVIVALFVTIIVGLVALFNFQMNAAVAIRTYVGGEGLWAKAQKDAVLSLKRYAVSRNEADFQAYLQLIQVPLGDSQARRELQQPEPDLDVVRDGFRQGRLHPDDIEHAITFFRRFQRTDYLSRVIEYWSQGDELIAELMATAEALRAEIHGQARKESLQAIEARLVDINRRATKAEDQFSATLAEASRWANDLSRTLTYVIAFLLSALGVALSWPIIQRIRVAENALIESEGRHRGIFEHASDVIFMIAPDGRLTSVSPACERVTGWLPGELIGQSFSAIVHPDDMLRTAEVFRKTLAGQSTANHEVRLKRKNGEYFTAEHSLVPLGGATVTGVLGIARDISERKRAEGRLRDSEQRLRAVLEATFDGLLVADLETGRFVIANRAICDMLGYAAEELYGLGIEDIHPPEVLPEVRRHFTQSATPAIGVMPNLPVRRKDGRIFFADVSAAPMTLGGRPHLVGVFHDVTERKQAEEVIRALNDGLEEKVRERSRQLLATQEALVRQERLALLGQVAGSVGHELRNPLGVISNAVYYLQTVLDNADDTTREYLGIIKDEIAGAESIVSQLLDAVRTRPPQTESVRVRELVDRVFSKVTLPASVTVDLKIPATLPTIRVDALQIEQVMRNLISNAIDAMAHGGRLEIIASANAKAGMVTLAVRDNGIGMLPEHMASLFQPLFTTKARGIGLGLVVVKNLTEANGGSVEVHSEPGKGSVFSVTLPADEEAENESA